MLLFALQLRMWCLTERKQKLRLEVSGLMPRYMGQCVDLKMHCLSFLDTFSQNTAIFERSQKRWIRFLNGFWQKEQVGSCFILIFVRRRFVVELCVGFCNGSLSSLCAMNKLYQCNKIFTQCRSIRLVIGGLRLKI